MKRFAGVTLHTFNFHWDVSYLIEWWENEDRFIKIYENERYTSFLTVFDGQYLSWEDLR